MMPQDNVEGDPADDDMDDDDDSEPQQKAYRPPSHGALTALSDGLHKLAGDVEGHMARMENPQALDMLRGLLEKCRECGNEASSGRDKLFPDHIDQEEDMAKSIARVKQRTANLRRIARARGR